MELEFKEVTNKENSRTYVFANGEITINNVARVCARPSGSHRVETVTGEKYIVASGWIAIKLDMADWSF